MKGEEEAGNRSAPSVSDYKADFSQPGTQSSAAFQGSAQKPQCGNSVQSLAWHWCTPLLQGLQGTMANLRLTPLSDWLDHCVRHHPPHPPTLATCNCFLLACALHSAQVSVYLTEHLTGEQDPGAFQDAAGSSSLQICCSFREVSKPSPS